MKQVILSHSNAVTYAHELTKLAIEQGLIRRQENEAETANAIADFFDQLVIRFTTIDQDSE